MDEKLLRRTQQVITAYRKETDHWPATPRSVVQSRERLSSLVALEAPEWVVRSEVRLLYKRLRQMRQARLTEDTRKKLVRVLH